MWEVKVTVWSLGRVWSGEGMVLGGGKSVVWEVWSVKSVVWGSVTGDATR